MPGTSPTPRARASMADVGRLAEVSAQTVSRYFSGRGYVSDATRARIEAAVAELDFRPNLNARSLRSGRSHTIGVLAVGPINYGTAEILSGLTSRAQATSYAMAIAQLDLDMADPASRAQIRRALDGLLSATVDGVVVMTPYLGLEDLLEGRLESVPAVTVSGRPRQEQDSVTVDSHAAGVLGTRHLVDLGHTRILHLAGPTDRNEANDREQGYREVLAEAGLEPLPLVRGDWSAASGHVAAMAVAPGTFTAVAAGNDQMALGFLAGMRERGLGCPRDFSIVGVDDMPDARYFAPALSTVEMDFARLGRVAIDMLRQRIDSGEHVPRTRLEPRLVVRDSTAPPG
ncbi:MAG: LacI family transcriptional regulator [Actinomycetales bacterium]|nr:LacI family transcriptional regulator [Actinomycetales bacterium]